mgnify:CR=1 FL=1
MSAVTREQFLEKHFPEVDCGREPCGNKITVQLLSVPKKIGSIVLAGETKDFNKQATTVAKLIKVGPIAYKDRSSNQEWPEGRWCEVGDLVLVHRYGGLNRVEIPHPNDPDDTVVFCTYNDYDVLDRITGQYEVYSKIL